ncbi:MAG: hypothetical protein H7X80_11800 [bacterium]|nr:hypothetical protein [Candidatus Kapabacteria bacterium]
MKTRSILSALLIASVFAGCIDESVNAVVFDQLLETTTFDNRLLARVVIYRDGTPIDTLNALKSETYPLYRKGAITHAWKLIAPIDNSGEPAGVEPYQSIGVQFKVRATYVIDNEALAEGTLFTPRIANLSPYSLRITANYGTQEQFPTNYTIPSNRVSPIDNAPYYYWISSSNILLSHPFGGYYRIDRDDSTSTGILRLESNSRYPGAGVTEPITIY